MNKYLFTTLPSNDLGLLTRSLPIARELHHRGHHVAFCSPARSPNMLISEAGFNNILPSHPAYYIISWDNSLKSFSRLLHSHHMKRDVGILLSFIQRMFQSGTAEVWDIDHFMYLLGMWNEEFIRAMVEALMDVIRIYQPDVIVDFWNPFASIAAKASHTPLITVIQADMHPASQGFIWWKHKPAHIPSAAPTTNKVLADYSLPPVNSVGDLLTGDMTLVVGMPETDPLPPTADVTYIGSVLWQRHDEKLPDWVADLSREQPVIWVYPGNLHYMYPFKTSFDSTVVLKACIEALGNAAVQVVLSTGHHALPRHFVPLPPNFQYEPYVPGLAMAERSDLLIHHGGYGSCQTGIYTGTPSLIIPTYSERESNARRIADQGAGCYILPTSDVTGVKKQVCAEEVRTQVFRILSDSSFTEHARRLRERLRTYGSPYEAACLIDSFVRVRTEGVV